jgi:hypothetical protein
LAALLTIVGLGPVLLLAPDRDGTELFLAPFVGLAILYWVSQWLSPHYASGPVIVVTCLFCGSFSVAVLWIRRTSVIRRVSAARVDLAILSGFGLLIAMVLQLPLLHTGTFTLADFSGDDLFTWAPTAAYMQTHAYAAGHPTAYVSPLLWLLPTNVYPGSAGTVDGGLLTVFGMHAYQLVEPLSAVCLALGACVVYLLLRAALGTSRAIAVLGLLLVATNQSRFFTSGFGLAQSARGTTLMLAAILIFIMAFTNRSVGMAILAGGITAVLAGVYMPAFLITLAAVVGGALVALAPVFRGRVSLVPWRVVLAFVASGLLFGVQNIRWLLLGGGLHAWVLQTSYGRDVFFLKYPLQYLAGSAPFQYLYRAAHIPPFAGVSVFWSEYWSDVAVVVALAFLFFALAGAVSLVATRRMLPAACLIVPLLYGASVYLDNKGGFGSVLTVFYLMPIVCVLATLGFDRLMVRIRRPSPAQHAPRTRTGRLRLGTFALFGAVGLIVVFQVGATAQDESFYVHQPGMLSPANLKLSSIASVVPKGATVLMYASDGSNGYATVRKTQALVGAASFLPDRDVTIDGSYFTGTFGPADRASIASALKMQYQYVLHYVDPSIRDPRVPSAYRVVWRFPQDRLVLYERDAT